MKIDFEHILGISALAGTVRAVLHPETFTIKGMFRRIFISSFVGYSSAIYFHDKLVEDPKYLVAVILCAFIADDILLGILKVSGYARDNATDIIKKKGQ